MGHHASARLLEDNPQWKGKHPFRDSGELKCPFAVMFLSFVISLSSFQEFHLFPSRFASRNWTFAWRFIDRAPNNGSGQQKTVRKVQ